MGVEVEGIGGGCEGDRGWGKNKQTYPADDVIVVSEMGFAALAAVDAVAVEVGVVAEAHGGWWLVVGIVWRGRDQVLAGVRREQRCCFLLPGLFREVRKRKKWSCSCRLLDIGWSVALLNGSSSVTETSGMPAVGAL